MKIFNKYGTLISPDQLQCWNSRNIIQSKAGRHKLSPECA